MFDGGLDGMSDGGLDGGLDGMSDGMFDGGLDGMFDGMFDGVLDRMFCGQVGFMVHHIVSIWGCTLCLNFTSAAGIHLWPKQVRPIC